MARRDQVAADYDDAAAGYDQGYAADAATRRRTAILDELQVDAARGARRVLELGCGTGRLLVQVDAPTRLGVDVSSGMLARAADRGLAVARADAHELPFADGQFDAVLAGKGVFRYLDPDRAFDEAARVLRPGGVLALHNYGSRTLTRRGRSLPRPGLWELASVAELLAPAERAGFTARAVHRFRSIRVRPYLLAIPAWLDRRAPWQLWSHCVAVFTR